MLHDTLPLNTTLPLSGEADEGGDAAMTVVNRRLRWENVHRQARRIAERNAARRNLEAECEIAERRARRALNRISYLFRRRSIPTTTRIAIAMLVFTWVTLVALWLV